MGQNNVKEQAQQMVERLPEDATWEDIMYEIYVRQAIEKGIKDCDEGRTHTIEEVRQKLGLPA